MTTVDIPGQGNVFSPDDSRLACGMRLSEVAYAMAYTFKAYAWLKVYLYCGLNTSVYLVYANGDCEQVYE